MFSTLTVLTLTANVFAGKTRVNGSEFGIVGDEAVAIYKLMKDVPATSISSLPGLYFKTGPGIQCIGDSNKEDPEFAACVFSVYRNGEVKAI